MAMGANSMTDILIDPADRGRGFVVVAYVARKVARQTLNRSEDATRKSVALNLGKPNSDLVEPARVFQCGTDQLLALE